MCALNFAIGVRCFLWHTSIVALSPILFFCLRPSKMVPGLRRNLSCSAAVSIGAWQRCLEAQRDVVHVQPLLNADGSSRKSIVDPKVIQNGGGHLCPHELEVYIGKTTKKARVTAGLTRHGGLLHVYFREYSGKLDIKNVKEIFFGAAVMLETQAIKLPPTIPPPPTRPVPRPPPAAHKLITTQPLPPPLTTYDLTVLGTFDGDNYGLAYLSLQYGQKLRHLPPPEDGEGWWYGEVEGSRRCGWFPPTYVSEEF